MPAEQLAQILARLPQRISDVAKPWAERSPERLALVETSGTWTYAQLEGAIARTEAWLRERAVRPGDRVMLVCENCRAFVAMLMALARLGAWPVLVNARLSARELDEVREHCGARLVIYTVGVSHHARVHC